MKIFRLLSLSLMAAFSFLLLTAAPAQAQATRTWISGVGDDANPCSRTAPCKTFAGAISKTAAGGEINCLDPGGFGGVTITKSMTLRCIGVEGGVLVSGTNAIVINAAATDVVVLDGLDIQGFGTGLNGVRILQVGQVQVLNTTISSFRGSGGSGISFQPPNAGAKLILNNVNINDSGNGSGAGILLQPTGTGSGLATIQNTVVSGNATTGIRADATGNTGTGGISFTLDNVQIGEDATGMFLYAPAGNAAPIKAMVAHSTIANNSAPGVLVNGTPITALFSDTTITGNLQGVNATGGTVISYGDNRLFGNGSNNTFPTTIAKN